MVSGTSDQNVSRPRRRAAHELERIEAALAASQGGIRSFRGSSQVGHSSADARVQDSALPINKHRFKTT